MKRYNSDWRVFSYRKYPAEIVKRIRFIKRAQSLGFTLRDVSGLLRLNNRNACAKTRELAMRKLALIEEKLSELTTMRNALGSLVHQCERKLKGSACPIIDVLQWDSPIDPSESKSLPHHKPS